MVGQDKDNYGRAAATQSGWVVDFLNSTARKEMDAQNDDIQSDFLRLTQAIEKNGWEDIPRRYIARVKGKLWEMRLRGRNTIARALCLTVEKKHVMVCRVFTKKTERTPRHEIELALKRAKEAGYV